MLLGRKALGGTGGGRETSGAAAPGVQARDRCSEQREQKAEVDLPVLGVGCDRGREEAQTPPSHQWLGLGGSSGLKGHDYLLCGPSWPLLNVPPVLPPLTAPQHSRRGPPRPAVVGAAESV